MDFPPLYPHGLPEDENGWNLKEVEIKDLVFGPQIGEGGQGAVYMAKYFGSIVAVKVPNFSYNEMSEEEVLKKRKSFWFECGIMHDARHPNIVQLIGVVVNPLCCIMEYMENGSIRSLRSRAVFATLSPEQKLDIAGDAAAGILSLHKAGYGHFDIKPDNLVVCLGNPHRAICKVADFGSAAGTGWCHTIRGRGTLGYVAPEMVIGGGPFSVSIKCDSYSFALAVFFLLEGRLPDDNIPLSDARSSSVAISDAYRGWKPFFRSCLHFNPNCRMDFGQICRFFQRLSGRAEWPSN